MVINDEARQSAQKSHLFMLRVWLEDLGNGQMDWRGKVQHVNSGEVRYFRDWRALESFVEWKVLKNDANGVYIDEDSKSDNEPL